jgi:hypothetical protein
LFENDIMLYARSRASLLRKLLLERGVKGGRNERGGTKSGSWGLPSPRYYFNYFFLAAFFFAAFFLAFFFAAIIVSFKVN